MVLLEMEQSKTQPYRVKKKNLPTVSTPAHKINYVHPLLSEICEGSGLGT